MILDDLIDCEIDGFLLLLNIGRPLALDDNNRNAVYKQDDVWNAMLFMAEPFDFEFRCAVIHVVLWVFPVNVVNREAFGVSLYGLRYASSERKKIVSLLVLISRPCCPESFQSLERILNRVF